MNAMATRRDRILNRINLRRFLPHRT